MARPTASVPLLIIFLASMVCSSSAAKPFLMHVAWGQQHKKSAIGNSLEKVARDSNLDLEHAANLLDDDDVGFDKNSKKFIHACDGMTVPENAPVPDFPSNEEAPVPTEEATVVATASASPGGADPTDLSMAFKLHSRPGAPRVLLLDFTGYNNTASQWLSSFRKPFIYTPPYDFDNNTSSFSNAELTNIITIWRAVAEDYAFADVDVTTEEFDAAGNPIALADKGARAVIGGSSLDWYGASAGGVAYTGTFGHTFYDPAYVFPKQLGGGSTAKYIWEAVSHELGHRLGLSHDGQNTTTYFNGQANWAPIMGCGYYKAVTQFSKGEYPYPTNTQDDLTIMTAGGKRMMTVTGPYISYRPDDHGSSMALATVLLGAANTTTNLSSTSAVGNIETTGDADWMTFRAGKGSATINVIPTPNSRANVDLKLEVWAFNGTAPLVAFNTAGGLLSGTKTTTLPFEGPWYFALQGVQDPNGTVGYSSYASLGEYKVTFDYVTPLTAA